MEEAVRRALAEDLGQGDLTSAACVPQGLRARAVLLARAEGRVAGLVVYARVFEVCDPACEVELLVPEGATVGAGERLATVVGDARALLAAERSALNFVQHLSGIATSSARAVALCRPHAEVFDTRKTTPGLRALEKYAVRCGGARNHRFGLFDEIMIKDNHVDLAGRPLEELCVQARRSAEGVRVTVEARDEAEALAAARGGADVVMLDNMDPAAMAELCPRVRAAASALDRERAVEIEASGGVDETTIAAVAASGVDRISIGALTHSAPALDLAVELEAVE
ncbi:MAG: carboxylating nicotinate-nucleotide diphosphorylase [Planctomycetota bacterium]|nr:carboxylating nicotinate-nucleotide diphosphorylase [Planctomycetota bacterium]